MKTRRIRNWKENPSRLARCKADWAFLGNADCSLFSGETTEPAFLHHRNRPFRSRSPGSSREESEEHDGRLQGSFRPKKKTKETENGIKIGSFENQTGKTTRAMSYIYRNTDIV